MQTSLTRSLVLWSMLLASAASGGCASETSGPADSFAEEALASSEDTAAQTIAAFDALDAQRNKGPLVPYYEDGIRVAACWKNPAGNKLTDIQKAFYCAMPLEFRLCNTVVLLTHKDPKDVAARYQGFLDCQRKLDGIFGDAQFRYGPEVNATYKALYLERRSGLDADGEARLIAQHRPSKTSLSFPVLLGKTIEGLTTELRELQIEKFSAMVHQTTKQLSDGATAEVSGPAW